MAHIRHSYINYTACSHSYIDNYIIQKSKKRKIRKFSNVSVVLFKNGQVSLINRDQPLIDQADLIPYDSRYEIDRKKIKLGKILGQGEYGRVVLATASKLAFKVPNDSSFTTGSGETVVAVKMVNDQTSKDQLNSLMTELKILRIVGHHPNIVNLLGACTSKLSEGDLLVIVEYCHLGNLRQYLIKNRENFVSDHIKPVVDYPLISLENDEYMDPDSVRLSDQKVSLSDLISYSYQIARGMEYLSSRRVCD